MALTDTDPVSLTLAPTLGETSSSAPPGDAGFELDLDATRREPANRRQHGARRDVEGHGPVVKASGSVHGSATAKETMT